MAESLVLEWLQENELRAYPLKPQQNFKIDSINLSIDKLILDARLIYFSESFDDVAITKIECKDNVVKISVTGQDVFVIPHPALVTYPYYCTNNSGSLLVVGDELLNKVAGDFEVDVNFLFEPAVIYDLTRGWNGVTSLSFNEEAGFIGAINWKEGYQFKIDINKNIITLGADKNYGLPVSCEQFFENLVRDCGNIVSYINGVTIAAKQDVFHIIGDNNVVIYDDPANHRLYIGLHFDENDVCKTVPPNPISI